MKSDFSRFLHLTQSYSGLTRISRWNKFATWFDLDTPVKPECDSMGTDSATCRGRSMVEMLGVLAIIGVLSVGAIAGYSKAMMKYKLNKQAEQYNQLISSVTSLKTTSKITQKGIITQLFLKLGLIPTEMIKDKSNYIYDIFSNKIYFSKSNTTMVMAIFIYLPDSGQQARDMCRNIIFIAKEYHNDLYYLEIISDDGDRILHQYYGDQYCGGLPCINKISLNNADDMCRGFNGRRDAMINIWWKV